MTKEAILPLVRHLLTFFGGVVAANGYATEGQITEIVGALMTMISVGWMIAVKRTDAK
jgi:hypothetical protein